MIPVPTKHTHTHTQVVEYSLKYDGDSVDVEGCQITQANEGVTCTLEIEVDE